MMTNFTWLIFLIAALLEIGGDSIVRSGLRINRIAFIALGFAILGSYGLVVNMVKWDFSRLLGVYVAVFAVVSVFWGKVILKEDVALSTWIGLVPIVIGGLIIQFGPAK
jgi:drug/metabolite transporter superfamily protein YnfA